jgi:hypothetical protein
LVNSPPLEKVRIDIGYVSFIFKFFVITKNLYVFLIGFYTIKFFSDLYQTTLYTIGKLIFASALAISRLDAIPTSKVLVSSELSHLSVTSTVP